MLFFQTPYSTRDGGHYTPGVAFNKMLFISGQLSINPESGEKPRGGFSEEVLQALKNVELVLREAKLSKENVIMCRVYLPDVSHWPECNTVYADFFGHHKPARIIIPTKNLFADCMVEIEAIAGFNDAE